MIHMDPKRSPKARDSISELQVAPKVWDPNTVVNIMDMGPLATIDVVKLTSVLIRVVA